MLRRAVSWRAAHCEPRRARVDNGVRQALSRDLEDALHEASLAARRYEAVDPIESLVAPEFESRWNAALERVAELEARTAPTISCRLEARVDEAALMVLASDLPAV